MDLDEAILRLINKGDVGDQTTLLERLRANGYDITQPTLSRRLKRLNIRKQRGRYCYVERPNVTAPDFRLIAVSPNLVVLRTHPGFAQALAVKLDSENVAGVAGTIAGDDTVLIMTLEEDLEALCERIRGALESNAYSH